MIELGRSERRAVPREIAVRFLIRFTVVGQHRATQRKVSTPRADEAALSDAIVALAERSDRYGYRRVTALLKSDGWQVSAGRVYRIWQRAEPDQKSIRGLDFPAKAETAGGTT